MKTLHRCAVVFIFSVTLLIVKAGADSDPFPTRDFILANRIGFDTTFGNSQSRDYAFDIPASEPDWIVCTFVYANAKTGRGANFSVSFQHPVAGDPSAYRGVVFHLSAPASNNPLDRWTSDIWLDDVGIRAISSAASSQDRSLHNCQVGQLVQ